MAEVNIRKAFSAFILKLALLTILLGVINFSIKLLFPEVAIPSQTPTVYIFFFALTAVVHYSLLKANNKRDVVFIRVFMLSIVFKLLVYVAFIAILIALFRDQAKGLAVLFLVLYVFYTAFEMASIMGHLRSQKSTPK